MANTLIIFIDSLPFKLLWRTPFLNSFPRRWEIEPGFGYSVNVHAELFAGLLPDDVGYFGEWMYNPTQAVGRHLRPLLPLLDRIFRPYVLNRGLQHLLTRSHHAGGPMPNIPLRHLDKFAREGVHIQSPDFPGETLFTEFDGLHALHYRGIGRAKGERDAFLLQQAQEAIEEHHSLFVPLPDLDGLGHRHGIDGGPYVEHLNILDDGCRRLTESWQKRYPQGHVFVVSDHGMVNVTRGVYLDIEEKIGRASEKSYLYFSDANLLRVWIFDDRLSAPLRAFLEAFPYGQLVTEDERRRYGLKSTRFGNLIYVLDEGYAFEPSTFARNIPRGMHGYHPRAPYQQAVALHYGPPLQTGSVPTRMSHVYYILRAALEL